ncbi:MAG: hypothetical protein IJ794_12210 [Lachnospiraceae bacterium]|nr:hypothetical protein [Lachnospiraceae bacterium]
MKTGKNRLPTIYIGLTTFLAAFGFLWVLLVIGADLVVEPMEKMGAGAVGYWVFDVFLLRGMPILLLGTIVACIIVGIANVVCAFRNYRRATELCIRNLKLLKFGMIPCFVVNFIWMLCLGFGVAVASSLFGLAWFVPVAVIATWLYLLPGAFYGVQVVRIMRNRQGRGAGWCIFNGLLQFCFVLDVIDAAYLTNEWV